MRSVVCGLCAVLAGGLVLSPAAALAAEGGSPVIGHVATTDVGEHAVKVEAQIDPEGLETSYEVRLVWQQADPKGGPTNNGERPVGGEQSQTGRIAAGSGSQAVSASFTELQWGYTYWYVIAAINSAGKTRGESPYSFGFHISGEFPNGMGTGPPYESEIPVWSEKLSEEESAKTLKEYEARHAKELEAQHAKEHQEEEFREAAARSAEAAARELREEQERDKGGLSLASTSVVVQRKGRALVNLECLGIAGCNGKLTLTVKQAGRTRGGRKARAGRAYGRSTDGKAGVSAGRKAGVRSTGTRAGTVTIGTASFSIAGDEAKSVALDLNAAGRALLSADHGRLRARLAILELAPNSGTQTVGVRVVRMTRDGKHSRR